MALESPLYLRLLWETSNIPAKLGKTLAYMLRFFLKMNHSLPANFRLLSISGMA
jgi:hypothetical protein